MKKSEKQIAFENAKISESRIKYLEKLGYEESFGKKFSEITNKDFNNIIYYLESELPASDAQLKFIEQIKTLDNDIYVQYWGQFGKEKHNLFNAKKVIEIYKAKHPSINKSIADKLKAKMNK